MEPRLGAGCRSPTRAASSARSWTGSAGAGGGQQNALAIPHDEPSVEPELELDPSIGMAAVARSSGQLEDCRPGRDRPVVGHDALIVYRSSGVRGPSLGWSADGT